MRRALGVGAVLAIFFATASLALAQIPVPPVGGGEPPPPPPPPAVAPGPPGTDAVATEGFDAAHRYWSGDDSLRPPFGVLWKAKLGGVPRQLVTGGGRVFVEVAGDGFRLHSGLVALDGATGRRLWRANPVEDLAFAGGVLLVSGDSRLRALDPATGGVRWNRAESAAYAITPVGDSVVFRSETPDRSSPTSTAVFRSAARRSAPRSTASPPTAAIRSSGSASSCRATRRASRIRRRRPCA